MGWRGILAAALFASACATARDAKDGDARVDEHQAAEPRAAAAVAPDACGPEGKGDLALIDASSGAPLACVEVTVSSEAMACARDSDCPAEEVYRGRTNRRGQVASRRHFAQARLSAVADGFAPSYLTNATFSASKVLELEMAPLAGYWLKVIDQEGNYLPDVVVTFKKGAEVLGALRSNALANIFFTSRAPFSGDPVVAESEGFQTASIESVADLGDDGHTLTLKR